MKITRTDPIKYKHNPLIEVVCQVRFDSLIVDEGTISSVLQNFGTAGYQAIKKEQSFEVSVEIAPESGMGIPVQTPYMDMYHASTADEAWRASFCREYIALTCFKYENWDSFRPRFLQLLDIVNHHCGSINISRIGLRYKDLIEREALNLTGTAWHELIRPFLLGPLGPNTLSDGEIPEDEDISSMLSQVQMKVEGAMLLLQSTLLRSSAGPQRAFLIDADFFHELSADESSSFSGEDLRVKLEDLHANAGALFRRCIQDKLHHALCPI